MPITAIQPITDFSTIVPATPVAPTEVVSVAADLVTTPTSSTVVTLGEAQPLTQPLFDSSGNLVSPGTRVSTTESQALQSELQSSLETPSASAAFDSFAAALNASIVGTTGAASRNAGASVLALQENLLNAANLANENLLNAAAGASSTTDFTGLLTSDVELAIAGIGTGAGNGAASGQLSPIAITSNPAAAPATPFTPLAPATLTPATTPTATVTPAAAPPAIATPAVATPATLAPAIAGTGLVAAPAAAAPATPAAATPATPATGTGTVATGAAATGTTTAPAGIPTPADVLQGLVSDVMGRAVANLIDPGFASTAAGLFVSAAIFRAHNDAMSTTTMGTADTAGTPAAPVTAMRPAQPV